MPKDYEATKPIAIEYSNAMNATVIANLSINLTNDFIEVIPLSNC